MRLRMIIINRKKSTGAILCRRGGAICGLHTYTHTHTHTHTHSFIDSSSARVGLNVEFAMKRAKWQYAFKSFNKLQVTQN